MKTFKLKFYYVLPSGEFDVFNGLVSDKQAKPSLLRKIAANNGATFVTCEKYGCCQFLSSLL